MDKKKRKKPAQPGREEATGTYRYDKTLGKVVKVSDKVPGLSKGGGDFGSPSDSPCGSCPSGGACGMGGGFGGDF